jgi:hypothetical protein
MRNYELVKAIYDELTTGDGKGSFSNPYLNTVITLTKLIEEARPEMKGNSAKLDKWWENRSIRFGENRPELEETRFE